MQTSTTFQTTTGTRWTVTGARLTRLCSERGEGVETFAAVPNAIAQDGEQVVLVRVGSAVTFLADGGVKTTAPVAAILRVASVRAA